MVTSLTPFFTLPNGAYTMIPEWSSRKTSVASVSCGLLSIRRRFIAFDGQEHGAGGARLRNHGGFRPPSSKASASWSRSNPRPVWPSVSPFGEE
jgi:hypothetical protein